jgi:GNAT superfamily N-acetyltransferase
VIQTVLDEIYGGLWAPPPLPVDEESWHSFWVAVRAAKIIGVVRTSGEWLDDLWVIRENRGCGVGQRLLAVGEAEIIARGYETLKSSLVGMKHCIFASFNRMQRRSSLSPPRLADRARIPP